MVINSLKQARLRTALVSGLIALQAVPGSAFAMFPGGDPNHLEEGLLENQTTIHCLSSEGEGTSCPASLRSAARTIQDKASKAVQSFASRLWPTHRSAQKLLGGAVLLAPVIGMHVAASIANDSFEAKLNPMTPKPWDDSILRSVFDSAMDFYKSSQTVLTAPQMAFIYDGVAAGLIGASALSGDRADPVFLVLFVGATGTFYTLMYGYSNAPVAEFVEFLEAIEGERLKTAEKWLPVLEDGLQYVKDARDQAQNVKDLMLWGMGLGGVSASVLTYKIFGLGRLLRLSWNGE